MIIPRTKAAASAQCISQKIDNTFNLNSNNNSMYTLAPQNSHYNKTVCLIIFITD